MSRQDTRQHLKGCLTTQAADITEPIKQVQVSIVKTKVDHDGFVPKVRTDPTYPNTPYTILLLVRGYWVGHEGLGG